MASILYVEDHPPARMLMQAIITEMTDHTLLMAASGSEALAAIPETQPELYIFDLDLPDTDGLALAREATALHQAPVVIVSAYAESVDEEELERYTYLPKPLDPNNVAETIRRALA